jgi:hypothetical protein
MELASIIGLLAIVIIALLTLAYQEGFFGTHGKK